MPLKIGCDLVHIPSFAERIRLGGEGFLSKVFSPSESDGATIERLAGTFAAKEAACKALSIPAGNWRSITVRRDSSGAPRLDISFADVRSDDLAVSISHDGEYAMAVVATT